MERGTSKIGKETWVGKERIKGKETITKKGNREDGKGRLEKWEERWKRKRGKRKLGEGTLEERVGISGDGEVGKRKSKERGKK